MAVELDHLVVACSDLNTGTLWLEDMLGMGPQGGGEHATMGTHNKVWSLGGAFLELIAINPAGITPDRPRWFSLDEAGVQDRIKSGPRLVNWAVRVDDIDKTAASSLVPLGEIHDLSRGDLRWRVAIPADGGLLHGGHVPLVIQWQTPHPAQNMPDSGMRLSRLISETEDPAILEKLLSAIGAEGLVERRDTPLGSNLMAELSTNEGHVSLVG